jgi:seryl-tRNA(Sec) selenium transferase
MKPVPAIYRRLGVRPVIHASGTTTRYGGSLLRPEALEAMRQASQALVNIDELNEAAGAAIARMLGAEAAFVTAGASPTSTPRPGRRAIFWRARRATAWNSVRRDQDRPE